MKTDLIIYEKVPLRFHEGIPVFSDVDEYIQNYLTISRDHLSAYEREGKNPFVPEDLWVELETSTRVLLKTYIPENAMLLDVGVGLGRLISPLENVIKHGMDISFEYLEIARKKKIEVCFSRIEDMPYRKELFDAIVCTDVLEHVLDLNECCAKILSVLKPNGILTIRVPYREDLGTYLDPKYPYRYAHLRTFDEYALRLLFEKVFHCKVLEWGVDGYLPDASRLRYKLPIPKYDGIVLRLISLGKLLGHDFHKSLMKKLFKAVVINVVIKKME